MVSQSIRVNFIPSGVQDRIHASQYDTGERAFSFLCFYGSSLYEIPSGAVVTLNGQKPGGYAFVIPCTVDGYMVTCDCTSTMTDVAGNVECELQVSTGGETVQSANFILYVEPSAIDGSTVPSSDWSAVSEMVTAAEEAAESAAESAASIDTSHFVPREDITQAKTQTATGQKVVDAVELNPNVSGTLAYQLANLSSDAQDITYSNTASGLSATNVQAAIDEVDGNVDTLNSAVVKKADLSSSGTVTTANQYAADAWQLNPDNTGSYAAGVASQIASLTNPVDVTSQYSVSDTSKVSVQSAIKCGKMLYLQLEVLSLTQGWNRLTLSGPELPIAMAVGGVRFSTQTLISSTYIQAAIMSDGSLAILTSAAVSGNVFIVFDIMLP